MSISAIPSSILNSVTQARPTQTPFQADFSQLSKDLQSGNLSAAQTDFATLQKDLQGGGGAGPTNRFHQIRNHHLKDEGSSGSAVDARPVPQGRARGWRSPPFRLEADRFRSRRSGGRFPRPADLTDLLWIRRLARPFQFSPDQSLSVESLARYWLTSTLRLHGGCWQQKMQAEGPALLLRIVLSSIFRDLAAL